MKKIIFVVMVAVFCHLSSGRLAAEEGSAVQSPPPSSQPVNAVSPPAATSAPVPSETPALTSAPVVESTPATPAPTSAPVSEPAPSQTPATTVAPAATIENPGSPIPEGIEGRISLDLRNIEVVEALKFLAMKAGISIISTKNVAGRVTLTVDNVPVKDVFDIMLRSNGLAYTKQGEIYNIMTEDEYKALFGRKFSDLRMVKVFRIKYAIPEQVFSLLDTLKSEVGRVLVEPDSGTALIMDTPENVKRIEDTLATMEQKNLVKVFSLKYAKAKDVEEQLKTQLDAKKVGMIKADERANQVMVQTLPDRMAAIETLIASLDKKTKEVLIDAKIVKINLSNETTTGLNYEGLFKVGGPLGTTYAGSAPFSVLQQGTAAWQSRQTFLDSLGGNIGAYPFSGNTSSVNSSTTVAPGQNMHFGVISGQRDFDLLINYFQTLGKTQVLSNPKLAVINNQEARIHVGARQAYVTTTTTTGQTTTTVSEEVTFVDVGIQLSVTPTINDDGYVTMKVKPEISSVVDTLITPSGNKIPIIDTSMAETTVMVKDGSTIIIGGLRREDKVSNSSGIPFLSKLPVLGFIFRTKTDSIQRSELLVMLTPHVVSAEHFTTGEDDRELGIHPGKDEFERYPAFTAESIYNPKEKTGALEENIKPYTEYSDKKEIKEEEKNPGPAIKGEDGR